MICDLCNTNPAIFLVGNTETGDQTAMCGPDFARAGLEAAKAQLPMGEILGALGIESASEAETAAATDGGARRPKRGRRPASEPEPEPETTQGLEEAAAAPADGGDSSL